MLITLPSHAPIGFALPDAEALVGQVDHFITVCNGEQIRCAPDSCMCQQCCVFKKK